MEEAWVRPDFDSGDYSKIIFVDLELEYKPVRAVHRLQRDDRDGFIVSQEFRERLYDIFAGALGRELALVPYYEVSNEIGPETLLVMVGIKEIVSYAPPELVDQDRLRLSRVLEATLVIEIFDAESNVLLFRGVDHRAAKAFNDRLIAATPLSTWPVINRLALSWARGLRKVFKVLNSVSTE